MAEVRSGDMRTGFSNYDKGVPGTITWGEDGASVRTFSVTKNQDGRLDRIVSDGGAFVLDLDWIQHISGTWLIDRMEKTANGFGEVWAPTYTAEKRLDAITITRSTGEVITEAYNVGSKRLMGDLTRTVDGLTVLDVTNGSDNTAADIRNLSLANTTSGMTWTGTYDSTHGNLTQLNDGVGGQVDLTYDGKRRIDSITHAVPGGTSLTYNHDYDLQNRRVKADAPTGSGTTWNETERVYAFQGSRVFAIGGMDANSVITWTHSIGWGPMGPIFIDDLTGNGHDYYLFTDHLGTPFGHHNPNTNVTYHTPYNPWGELLATHPDPAPHYAVQGVVITNGFSLPVDAAHAISPLGLAGHLYDAHTGLVYMHNRHYHPRLGHFTTPDYRAPDIYDPTTYNEPYAYAAGNPMIFWDPNGLFTGIAGLWHFPEYHRSRGLSEEEIFLLFEAIKVRDGEYDQEEYVGQVDSSFVVIHSKANPDLVKTSTPPFQIIETFLFKNKSGHSVNTHRVIDPNTREEINPYGKYYLFDKHDNYLGHILDSEYGSGRINPDITIESVVVPGGIIAAKVANTGFKALKDRILIETMKPDKKLVNAHVAGSISPAAGRTTLSVVENSTQTRVLVNLEKSSASRESSNFRNWALKYDPSPVVIRPGISAVHIFRGEISNSGRAVGFHHQGSIAHVGHAKILSISTPMNEFGVYRAKVAIFNQNTGQWVTKGPKSSFFPDHWSRAQVLEEVRHAYKYRMKIPGKPAAYWQGRSKSGVEIGGYMDRNGNIATAFPIY